jgi:hypothetical protein
MPKPFTFDVACAALAEIFGTGILPESVGMPDFKWNEFERLANQIAKVYGVTYGEVKKAAMANVRARIRKEAE